MKLTIVSDTHGDRDTLDEIVLNNLDSEAFIHLGDGEDEFEYVRDAYYSKSFIFVRGNNDWGDWPQFCRMALGGHMFYMCHGHRFARTDITESMYVTAYTNGCDIALYGHTHVPRYEIRNGVHILNPGSPVLPRSSVGATYAVMTIDDKTKEIKARIIPV